MVPGVGDGKREPVKLAGVETFMRGAGRQPWSFAELTTDHGIAGPGWDGNVNEVVLRAHPRPART